MRFYESELAEAFNNADASGARADKLLVKRLKQEWDEHNKHIETHLPPHVHALHFARVDDARVRRIVWNRRERTLKLLLRVDDNTGCFDVNIHYRGVTLSRQTVRNFHRAVRNKNLEFLYGQVGFANDEYSPLYAHRIVYTYGRGFRWRNKQYYRRWETLWHYQVGYVAVCVVFQDVFMETVPAKRRAKKRRARSFLVTTPA